MKKISKVILASTLVTGALLGTQAATPYHTVAEATTTPWYTYNGQTQFGGAFYLNTHFKNAVQHRGLSFNGYKISAPFNKKTIKYKKVHDQNVAIVSGSTASSVMFPVTKGTPIQKVTSIYGKPTKVFESTQGTVYRYQYKNATIEFTEAHKQVTMVSVYNGH
ncbi:immunodominant staphylococcal antigen IsaB family protein [Staphylococcus ratti]|uniref:Immunodominant staphylococcal antigen B n=1 Tax=Staphylococcus ratti TaxID=2892440 RepID=A0ABY3PD94_9STAP|nr:hypothetical protein [Staphylococcus ratti]UEX90288.1 hypothetical protein LN051_01030 [Staphylococcus ratti]